jgi:hypothetical protein
MPEPTDRFRDVASSGAEDFAGAARIRSQFARVALATGTQAGQLTSALQCGADSEVERRNDDARHHLALTRRGSPSGEPTA